MILSEVCMPEQTLIEHKLKVSPLNIYMFMSCMSNRHILQLLWLYISQTVSCNVCNFIVLEATWNITTLVILPWNDQIVFVWSLLYKMFCCLMCTLVWSFLSWYKPLVKAAWAETRVELIKSFEINTLTFIQREHHSNLYSCLMLYLQRSATTLKHLTDEVNNVSLYSITW